MRAEAPVEPTRQPVTGVVPTDLVDGQLKRLTAELIPAIGETIWPWQQGLTATAVWHAVAGKAIENGLTAHRIFAQRPANFDHHSVLWPMADLPLRTSWKFAAQC